MTRDDMENVNGFIAVCVVFILFTGPLAIILIPLALFIAGKD